MPEPVIFSRLKAIFNSSPEGEEVLLLLTENITHPLAWACLVNLDIVPVTRRIRKYVLNGDPEGARQFKESHKDTFTMGAVAVSPLVVFNGFFFIDMTFM
jgi:hypothetical protein